MPAAMRYRSVVLEILVAVHDLDLEERRILVPELSSLAIEG